MNINSIVRKSLPAVATAAVVASMAFSGTVSAAPITPTFDSFGELAAATFGGAGIPNDAVAITTFTDSGNTITLGMTATQRFSNPPLHNNGAGRFTAGTGSNFGGMGESLFEGAKWNFNFYIDISGGGTLGDYTVELLFDFDPGVGTDESVLGVLDFNAVTIPGDLSGLSLVEGSQNLLFGFLDVAANGVTPPVFPTFDPNATGEYSFALRVSNSSGLLGESSILVTVPEPGTLAVLGLGLLGLGIARRRKAA